MQRRLQILMLAVLCSAYATTSIANESAGVKKADAETLTFVPPPVPGFMLQQPATPLSLEQQVRQAEEAAERARLSRANEQPADSTSRSD